MSQSAPQACPNCQAAVSPDQRFCPNCGSVIAASALPTASSLPPYTQYPDLHAAEVASAPPPPPPASYSSGPSGISYSSVPSDPYPSVPSDPYLSSASGTYTPAPPPPNPIPPTTPKKKRSAAPLIIIAVIVIVFAAIGTGVFVQSHGSSSSTSKNSGGTNSLLPGGGSSILPGSSNNSNTSAGNTADSQTLNLQITYSSDQITVTSLQQADKFSDDSLTSYSQKPNFVRMNFKEQQQAKQSSYFSYSSAFRLVLPDNTSVAPESSREFSGPQQSVSRSNWIDFPTSARVDLTQLTLQLGTGEEAQMTIPLKDGADLSKYQTKTVQLNKTVTYADAQWTLQNATQSYSFNGKQAAKGKVYLTVQMVANNSTDNELFLSSFVRLKSGTDVSSPEYSSDANNFDIIKPRTTNIQGSETFLTPPNTQYTLDFLSNSTISEQTVDFQMQ